MFKKLSKKDIVVLVKLAQNAEKEIHELLDYFNGDNLTNKYPDLSERLKASCPEKFLGGDIYNIRSALKLRKDLITVALRGLRNGGHPEIVLLNEKLCSLVKTLLSTN
jgi:hypothetical protein